MRPGRPKHEDILTPREWDVLELIRDGLTNEQIAARLRISLSGAKYHVAEIISKLGVESRDEAVRKLGERKRIRAVFPINAWLPAFAAGAKVWKTVGISFAAVGVAGLTTLGLLVSGLLGEESGPGVSNQPAIARAGLDVAPTAGSAANQANQDGKYERTLLLTKSPPVNVGDAGGTLASLRHVDSREGVEAAFGPELNLIIVDQSALGELEGSDIVKRQLEAGRSLMGLNIPIGEFYRLLERNYPGNCENFDGLVWETSPEGETRYFDGSQPGCEPGAEPRMPEGIPFYSVMTSPTEQEMEAMYRARTNDSKPIDTGVEAQMSFITMAGDTFERILSGLDAGEYTRLLPDADYCEQEQPDGSWRRFPC